jgi:hypothetical protein
VKCSRINRPVSFWKLAYFFGPFGGEISKNGGGGGGGGSDWALFVYFDEEVD